jgi:hypothetical protein
MAFGGLTGSLDHASDAHAPERLATLVYEHPSRSDILLLVLSLVRWR